MKLALFFVAVITPFLSFAQMDNLSKNVGIIIANSVKSQGIPVEDYNAFLEGFKLGMSDAVTPEQLNEAQQKLQVAMQQAQAEKSVKAKEEGVKFLAENAKRAEVKTTASGLQYEVIKEGAGEHPKATDKVTVHYTGKNLDGSVFDSSVERGTPATFGLNQVIKGWTEGVQLMTPGSKYRFYIPSDLAYGDRGAGSDIAPGATLIFDVELIKVN